MKSKANRITAFILGFMMVFGLFTVMPGVNLTVSAEIASGDCGDNLTWTLTDGVLEIEGTGDMWDFGGGPVSLPIPWMEYWEDILEVKLPVGLTSIGEAAFVYCTSLESVVIPTSVTSIGMGAFFACHKIESIVIPNSVTIIGNDAFIYCYDLKNITVDSGNPNYTSDEGVLFNKSKTIIIKYPEGKTGIYYEIPTGVTNIENSAFEKSISLKNIKIPASVTSIGDMAFYYCTSLESATFLGNAPVIGSNVFGSNAPGFTIYYYEGATGFTTPKWNGYDTSVIPGTEPPPPLPPPPPPPPPPQPCTHDFGAWTVTTPATTAADGVETRTCTRCGASETRAVTRLPETSAGTAIPDVNIPVDFDEDKGSAVLSLDEDTINSLIADALKKAGESDTPETPVVTFDLSDVDGAKSASVIDIDQAKMFSESEAAIKVVLPNAEVTLDLNTLDSIVGAADDLLEEMLKELLEELGEDVDEAKFEELREQLREEIGAMAVTVEAFMVRASDLEGMKYAQAKGYEMILSLDVLLGGKKVDVPLTVSVPYTLRPNENSAAVRVWYMSDDGVLTDLAGVYDAATGMITFNISHQSYFVVGYDPVTLWENIFDDIDLDSGDWYNYAVAFANYHGLMRGYGGGKFAPGDTMTRAMFVTVLWNIAGNPDAKSGAEFDDVGADAWYHDAVIWAAENGITAESNEADGGFAPGRAITRQEMAVFMYNFAGYMGYEIPENREMIEFDDFGDADGWAKEAIEALTMAGVLNGMGDGIFAPQATATRAQVATIFQNFMRFIDVDVTDEEK